MGILPEQYFRHCFKEECSNSASTTPVSRNFHTPLERSPDERTKVVTMRALLKFVGLHTLFPVYSFQIQQWLQCLLELAIRHGFQSDSTQSHCLPVLFIGQLFVCCRDLLGAGSVVAASVAGSFSTGVAAGNNSEEEDGLREGRENVLSRLLWESLLCDWDLAICDIWWGRVFGGWGGWCDSSGGCGGCEGCRTCGGSEHFCSVGGGMLWSAVLRGEVEVEEEE